jgi:L-cysteine desulfidase
VIKIKNELLEILKKECVVATGCTEPIAVALAAATAREQMDPGREEPQEIVITVDGGLYKNAALVGIPGIKERGIAIAAALGAAGGDTKLGLRLLESISSDQLEAAKLLVNQNKIRVLINEEYSHLYIKVDLYTQENHIRVLTLDRHQNIVLVEKGRKLAEEEAKTKLYSKEADMKKKAIQKYDLQQLLEFVNSVDIEDIRFLSEGVRMGREIAEAGFCLENGFGQGMARTIGKRKESGSLVASVQAYCGAATEARMAGVQKPVMTSAGSGNHGLTVFLTNLAVAEELDISDEILLRAIALSNLITIYIKSFTGTLSAMCGCGVAAGVGAGAGIAYMFGGDERTIYHAMLNMTGSMAGILCDGGKKGCAYKVALASGWAVQSALLALEGLHINDRDGILSKDMYELFKNLGFCTDSMLAANHSMIEIIRKNEMC